MEDKISLPLIDQQNYLNKFSIFKDCLNGMLLKEAAAKHGLSISRVNNVVEEVVILLKYSKPALYTKEEMPITRVFQKLPKLRQEKEFWFMLIERFISNNKFVVTL